MPSRHLMLREQVPPALREGLRLLRASLGVPRDFPRAVLAEAEEAAANPILPELDRTDLPFITIDPEGSTDLDQAVHLARSGDGFCLHYAIADVAAFVRPGGLIDAEAHRRGQTFYAPTSRTPLHPPVLSEGAASLLPGQTRPALLWELQLDAEGRTTAAVVRRALVRSRQQLTYVGVQAALDAGTTDEQLQLLAEVGRLREGLERERGGVSLPVPEQEIVAHGERWELTYRATLPVEGWNAQISLATGMAAAQIMLEGGLGVLRTLPPARDSSLGKLRRIAAALGLRWPGSMSYPEFVRSLGASTPANAAMLNACTLLFRGAGYQAFDGAPPEQKLHAAIAAPYAHTTAPLRRLVDRYVGEVCLAHCAGTAVPDWASSALADLPAELEESDRRAKKYDRGIVDLVEALVLAPRLGQSFTGTVLESDPEDGTGTLQLADPAVEATIRGDDLVLGEQVTATLVAADLLSGKVAFRVLD
ncbi:MAG: RNB domain-containing ribonuclease [Micropruina sp.]|nr:RNB domain-containing ribonuclease [Micropruina sp.]